MRLISRLSLGGQLGGRDASGDDMKVFKIGV